MAKQFKLPCEPKPEQVVAILDSREQIPYDLAPMQSVQGTLQSGDYSIKGLESIIAVERKSLSDLISCVGTERERFEKELHRLAGFPAKCVVVEASWNDILAGEWRSQVTAQSAAGSIAGWMAQGIPFAFCGNRENGQQFTTRFLFVAARRRYREARELVKNVIEEKEAVAS